MTRSKSVKRARLSLNTSSNLDIKELYRTTKGEGGDWGIDGYKTPVVDGPYIHKEWSVGTSNRTFMRYVGKRASEPGPANYTPTIEKQFK